MNKIATALDHRKCLAMLTRQSLFTNAGYLLGVNVTGALAGFVFWGLAARLYKPEDVGTASAVLSATTLISGIAGLGVSVGVIRFLPESQSPNRLLNTSLVFSAATSILAGGVFLTGLALWLPSLIVLQQNTLYAAGFLIFTIATTLNTATQAAFIAHRRAFYALLQALVINISRLILAATLAGLGAVGLVGAVALGFVLTAVLSLSTFLPKVEQSYRPRLEFSRTDLARIIPYSIGNYVASLLTQTSQMVIPLVVLEVLGPASSGYAYIAWMLGSLLTSPGIALANSAFAEGSNSPDRLPDILMRATSLGLLVTLPAAIILGIAAPWVLLLFGESYAEEASGLLRWLAAAAPMVLLTWLYFTRLRVQKRIGRLIAISAGIAVVILGVGSALLPLLGLVAVGIGWLAGNGLVAVAAVSVVLKRAPTNRKTEGSMATTTESHPLPQKPFVAAAIPCYNEARFIGDVVRRALEQVDAVVVVDDGSTDDTAEAAQKAGAQVIRHPANLGPGAAAQDCLQAGRDLQADILVTLDGDGQHNPDEIPEVIAPILDGEADLVIGSRFLGRYNNVAAYRRFGIDVITFLYNFGSRVRITDGQSCFRAYNRRALETLAITEPGFGFSVETLVQARNANLHIREASISCIYHEESHSMNPVIHGMGVALMVVKHRVKALLTALARSPEPATYGEGNA
jgi:O-antigen/teichoic acid export membrane protein